MSNIVEVKIPDIGGSRDVNVAEVYIKVGDKINVDDNLLMLETDKATMEVPATLSGIVKDVVLKVGNKVNEGDLILHLETTDVVDKSALVTFETPGISTPTKTNSQELNNVSLDKILNIIEVKIPDIGGSRDVNIAEVYIKAGDKINVDDNLLMLETDKATMEVPATVAGIVKDVVLQVGNKVNEGDLILRLEATEVVNKSAPVILETSAILTSTKTNPQELNNASLDKMSEHNNATTSSLANDKIQEVIDQDKFIKAFASPSIRKLARELGVDLTNVKGSGTKGRITEADLKEFVKYILSGNIVKANSSIINGSGLDLLPWPKVDFAKFGEIELKDLSRIKKLSGANLARNWVMIPHVTQFDEADITDLEAFRKELNEENKKQNIKITPLAFMIKAIVYALREFPDFNSSIDGDKLVCKKYMNIGFAADTPNGLVVPVLKDADKKGIVEIAKETALLASAARDGKLKPVDMQGGTFTISSLGGIGGTAFTPIINAPEVAILGVSKSSMKPVWNGTAFIPRLIVPLSLSYDHRIIDGASAAKFTSYLSKVLSDIRRLVL